jgi:Ni,Fe-hydrogenase III component G
MVVLEQTVAEASKPKSLAKLCHELWKGKVVATVTDKEVCRLRCGIDQLVELSQWLTDDLGFAFATLIVEEEQNAGWSLLYIFYKDDESASWAYVELELVPGAKSVPSISGLAHGPSADWHEREAEDLFGLTFEGHPRLGEFVLHEDWPEGVNPMLRRFDPRRIAGRELDVTWKPPTVVVAPGAFAMPIGPVFSDFAESAHFLLETVGEDVIRTIPRFFYKYRGVEKIAEGKRVDQVLLLAERFSGTSAFAHGLAFCQAVEAICGIDVPPRALALRTAFAELERLRHHAAVIAGICNSTALVVATAQASLVEESLLRLTGEAPLSVRVAEARWAYPRSSKREMRRACKFRRHRRAKATRSSPIASLFEQLPRSSRGGWRHPHPKSHSLRACWSGCTRIGRRPRFPQVVSLRGLRFAPLCFGART